MSNADPIWTLVDRRRAAYTALSDAVFDTPEIAYTETQATALHKAQAEAEGFRVTEGLAGIPTALLAEAGTEGPVIAILGEYDALPGLSQEAGQAVHTPLPGAGHGHGCGHNLLGAGALMAAVAVKDWLADTGHAARIRYYGCPAEEGGAAKAFMVRAGLFDDVDAAITWHAATYTGVARPKSLANSRIDFTFTGKAAHAAAAPHLGRSALDAVELMNIGVNYLREHMPDDARVHYAYLNAGGAAPNVVPAEATVRQLVRARDLKGLRDLVARVRAIADGAALMTGTRVTARVHTAVSNLLGNRPLEEAMQTSLERLGPPSWDSDDRSFATAMRATLTEEDIAASYAVLGLTPDPEEVLSTLVAPLDTPPAGGEGSTDVGDVSWAVPTVQARVATCAIGTPFHTWQLTAQGKAPAAHKGMVLAAKAMATVAASLIESPATLQAARDAHRKALSKDPYECPIPADIGPPVSAQDT